MSFHQIQTGDFNSSSTVRIPIPAGKWKALMLSVSGTGDTGDTIALVSMANAILERRLRTPDGKAGSMVERMRETLDFFYYMNDLEGGQASFASATAGAFSLRVFIPFGLEVAPNSMHLHTNEDAVLTLIANATMLADSTGAIPWKLFGISAEIPETYELDIHSYEHTFAGAATHTETILEDNIAAVLVEDLTDKITNMVATLDGQPMIDDCDDDDLRALTYYETKQEAITNPLTLIDVIAGGLPSEALNDSMKIRTTVSAACTVTATALSIKPTPENVSQISAEVVAARSNSRIQRREFSASAPLYSRAEIDAAGIGGAT